MEAEPPAGPEASWLLRHKVELPDPIDGYVRRPEVEERCALLQRRLTVLHASGGFGKTALLAHCCRALRERGIVVAWLSVDEEDGRESVSTYLTLAFEQAGVATYDPARVRDEDAGVRTPDPVADSQSEYRINQLIRALEHHGAPCVLALDELERLRSPDAIAAINALLRRAPRSLHVGMAFRERPPGLEVAMHVLEGRGVTMTAEELRFTASDVFRFFDRRLSRRELARVVASSAGWPIALRIYRNERRHGASASASGEGGSSDTVAGWIETRLWRGMSAEDRDFVLDIALFDRLDTELIDEVTGARNSRRRIASLGTLAGLLSTAGARGTTMQLHPLIKAFCEKQRFEEDAERFRAIHREIARAFAGRKRVVAALRHAGEAGDPGLLGQIAERAGGVRLWLEQGLEVLRTVDGLLTAEVLSAYPRLTLVRCIVLIMSGEIDTARRLYGAATAATADFTRDREGGDDRALQIDHAVVQGLLKFCGCTPFVGPITEVVRLAERLANAPDTIGLLRGIFSLGMCMVHHQRTAFDVAAEWSGRARAELGPGSPYLAHVDFQAGSIAMAKGHTRTARACYDRALQVARASHLRDAGAVMIGKVLETELELERSAGSPRLEGARVSPRLLGECGAWFDIYAANAGVEAELALLRGDSSSAVAFVEDAREYARRTERPALARLLSALRVSALIDSGQVEEAGRAWRFDRLAEHAAECTRLMTQTWREVETLACARLRLLIACNEFDAARELAARLRTLSVEHGLVRTQMRGLALSMVLEHRAQRVSRARAHLVDYLRLYATADYARPLARERGVALALLEDVAAAQEVDAAAGRTAARLRAAIVANASAGRDPLQPELSRKELDVLMRLEQYRDKEIAWDLNLSYEGVRYRVRSIFAKLDARGRLDAVHRARTQGIIPPPGDASSADRQAK